MLIRKGWLGKNLVLAALALAWALTGGGCSKSNEPAPADTPLAGAAKTASAPVQQLIHEAPINPAFLKVAAHTKYGELRLKDLQYVAMTNLCPALSDLGPTSLTAGLAKPTLEAAVNWIAARQAATAEVDAKNDPELTSLVSSGYKDRVDNIIFSYMLRNEIMDQITTPTQAELKAYYDKIKPTLFQPFSFTVRLLMLQTYEPPYVVQAGDTLESIAQQVSGDPKMADLIRADVPSRPLRREAGEPGKPGKLFKPLYPGEKLLVPMNKERAQEVRTRMEALVRGFDKLTNEHERRMKFQSLAKKYDESGMMGEKTTTLPTGTKQDRPPLSEVVKAVHETSIGQVSKIFQTKHGFNVIFVEDKIESHSLPLEHPEVRKLLTDDMMKERIMKANDNLISALMDNSKLSIDYKLIASGDRLSTDTVVAILGDDKLAWKDLKGSWEAKGKPRNETTIRQALIRNQAFAAILFRDHLRPVMNDPKTELAHQVNTIRTALVGSYYLTKLTIDQMAKQLTPEKARAFYEKNKGKLYQTAAKASFDAPLMLLGPAQMGLAGEARQKALEALLRQYREEFAKLKTPEDFEKFKALLDQRVTAQGVEPIHAPTPIAVSGLKQQVADLMAKTPVGKWTEPVISEDKTGVFAIFIKSYTPAGVEPFDAVVDKINKELFLQENGPILKAFESEYCKRAEVRME